MISERPAITAEADLIARATLCPEFFKLLHEHKFEPWTFQSKSCRSAYAYLQQVGARWGLNRIREGLHHKSNEEARKGIVGILNKFGKNTDFEEKYPEGDQLDFYARAIPEMYEFGKREELERIEADIFMNSMTGQPVEKLRVEFEIVRDGVVKKQVEGMKTADAIIRDLEDAPEQRQFHTGLSDLDGFLRIVESSMLIIAGESSSGKTSLANQLLLNWMITTPFSAIYFSLETEKTRLMRRLIKNEQANFGDDQKKAGSQISSYGSRLLISDKHNMISDIVDTIKDAKKTDKTLKYVFVDYLQIVRSENQREYDRINEVVLALHSLAQEKGFIVVLLSQLSKEDYPVVKGERKRLRPTMNSLKGSGQIANAADYIIINHFPNFSDNNANEKQIDLCVVKNKEGRQGVSNCTFVGNNFLFKGRESDDEI